MPPTEHVFGEAVVPVCTICGMHVRRGGCSWQARDWLLVCPGVQWYPFESIPTGLATKTMLARAGLRPSGDPIACYAAFTRQTYVYLYARDQARPKRVLSDKQRVALGRSALALEASRTCARCARRVQSKRRLVDADEAGRVCVDCYEQVERERAQRRVYAWAASLFDMPDALVRVLDTETTGLDDDAEVIEVAITDLAGRILVQTLIRPERPIGLEATWVHGLTDADVVDAPRFLEAWPRIAAALEGTHVIAYNASFDQDMLGREVARYHLTFPARWTWTCLMEACAVFSEDGERWLSLGAVCAELGVRVGAHRALADVLAVLGVLRALAARARVPPAQELCAEDCLESSEGRATMFRKAAPPCV